MEIIMRLLTLTWITFAMYIVLTYLAIVFAPVPGVVTDDWREAKRLQRECEGHSITTQTYTAYGIEYEVTCEKKDD
jgi:hypothetical protein